MQFSTAVILAAAASSTTAAAVLPPLQNITESAVMRFQNATGGLVSREENSTAGVVLPRQNFTEEGSLQRRQNLTDFVAALIAPQTTTEGPLQRRQDLGGFLAALVPHRNATGAPARRRRNATPAASLRQGRQAPPKYDEAAEVTAFSDGGCRNGTAGPAHTALASRSGQCVALPPAPGPGAAAALRMRDLHPEDTSFVYAIYAYADAGCRGPGTPVPAGACLRGPAGAPWRAWQILVDDDLRAAAAAAAGNDRAADAAAKTLGSQGRVARRSISKLLRLV